MQAKTSDEYRYKTTQQNISKMNSAIYKNDHNYVVSGILFQEHKDGSIAANQSMLEITLKKGEEPNHMIISVDSQKAFGKNSIFIPIKKNSHKIGYEGNKSHAGPFLVARW